MPDKKPKIRPEDIDKRKLESLLKLGLVLVIIGLIFCASGIWIPVLFDEISHTVADWTLVVGMALCLPGAMLIAMSFAIKPTIDAIHDQTAPGETPTSDSKNSADYKIK